jgi:hypothetical protein
MSKILILPMSEISDSNVGYSQRVDLSFANNYSYDGSSAVSFSVGSTQIGIVSVNNPYSANFLLKLIDVFFDSGKAVLDLTSQTGIAFLNVTKVPLVSDGDNGMIGWGFTANTKVYVGGVLCATTIVNQNMLTFNCPTLAISTKYDIAVKDPVAGTYTVTQFYSA